MSELQQTGQSLIGPLMIDVEGHQLKAEERVRIADPAVGGIILFARNYDSPAQIADLVDEIRQAKPGPLLVSVDHEGGRVQRFRSGFCALPSMGAIGTLWDKEPAAAMQAAYAAGWVMGSELQAVGVDFSFAPVLDCDLGVSDVIGDRGFHEDPDVVAQLATAVINGLREHGVAAVGKHFPGHGSVSEDSHVAMPVDERALDTIAGLDLRPFQALIQQGINGMMPAHVIYPMIDHMPAGFSTVWLQQVLREQLGFDGAIFSDDLSMQAASAGGDVVQRARAAAKAGCDMLLVCNDPLSADKVIDAFSDHTSSVVSHRRLLRMQAPLPHFNLQSLQDSTAYRTALKLLDKV